MSEILKEIKQWCKAIGDEQHRKKVLRMEKEVKHEAYQRVQVREFGGELFFSFDGIPLLHEDDLAIDLGSAAREARGHFCDYRMTQDA